MLWSLALFSLLVSAITAGGGGRAREAADLVRNAELRACAEGGVDQAMLRVLDRSAAHWPADGQSHEIKGEGCALLVSVTSQDGKLNPNVASAALLTGLLQAAGADGREAPLIAAAMVAWRFPVSQQEPPPRGRDYRPPGSPFQSLGEIGLVQGMTPALLERIVPVLSLYHDGDPNLLDAAPLVRRAVAMSGGGDPDGDDSASASTPANGAPGAARFDPSVVEVSLVASDRSGHRFAYRVIAAAGGGAGPDATGGASPYRILAAEEP